MSNVDWYSTEDWYAPLHKTETPARTKKEKKKNRTAVRVIAGIVVLVVLIAASSLAFSRGDEPAEQAPAGEVMPDDWQDFLDGFYTSVQTDIAQIDIKRTGYDGTFAIETAKPAGAELSLQEVFAECSPSVVAISGYIDGKEGYNWGTGLIISEDGLIVTNTHVIDNCNKAVVTLNDDTEYDAKLIGADSISDIALLKIEARGLPAAQFGAVDSLSVGDSVAAIGNPLGESFRLTLTNGIISAIERGMSYNGHTMTLLQTNTALNEGNSGGPLFNMYGQVIGITNMKMMSSYSSIEGIGFAIPSSTVKNVVAELILHGEVMGRPALGITVGAIPDEAKEQYGLPAGLYVSSVEEKSDAMAKGVRVGDIITAVNGIPVTTTAEVAAIKEPLNVGDVMHLTLWRDGSVIEVDVSLVETNDLYK